MRSALAAARGRGAPARRRAREGATSRSPTSIPAPGVTPVVIWRNPRVVTRAAAAGRGAPALPPRAAAPAAGRGAARPDALDAAAARGAAGRTPPRRWRSARVPTAPRSGPTISRRPARCRSRSTCRPAATSLEFQADAELGTDRNAVVRVMISDRAGRHRRATRSSASSSAIRRAPATRRSAPNIAEYVALLPPNSHGEANPADKDPVPPPFDNTYNSPEHDAFVLKVKYQRNDRFFTENMVDGADRARLNQAWNDLFGSWPYHDAYLGMLADHYKLTLKSRQHRRTWTPAQIAALPAAVRPYVTSLRAHYDEVMRAQALAAARPRRRRAGVRQPRLAPAADGRPRRRACARSTRSRAR